MDVQALWDNRYKQGLPSLEKPDPFFESMYEQHIQRLFPMKGTSLDLAAGIGRHSHYLAEQHWQVVAVDTVNQTGPLQKDEFISLVAPYQVISHAERPVRQRGVVEYLGRK